MGDAVAVAVDVGIPVGVKVALGVTVGVRVGVAVRVGVDVRVGVGVGVAVAVAVGVLVGVAVGVAVGVDAAPNPSTLTGVQPGSTPREPDTLSPQHLTPPPVVRAQVCLLPAATAAMPLLSPITSTGVERSVVVPSPNWPYRFHPQHPIPPPVVAAHV